MQRLLQFVVSFIEKALGGADKLDGLFSNITGTVIVKHIVTGKLLDITGANKTIGNSSIRTGSVCQAGGGQQRGFSLTDPTIPIVDRHGGNTT